MVAAGCDPPVTAFAARGRREQGPVGEASDRPFPVHQEQSHAGDRHSKTITVITLYNEKVTGGKIAFRRVSHLGDDNRGMSAGVRFLCAS